MAPRKKKLRDLSREQLTREESNSLYQLLMASPPLVAAILAAALLENDLDGLLRGRLSRRDDATWNEMTEDRGPFGSFSQKIAAGYALGIYDQITRENLDIVRTIRNGFAHARKPIDFDHPLVLAELSKTKVRGLGRKGIGRFFHAIKSATQSGHESYVVLCGAISIELGNREIRRVAGRISYRNRRQKQAGAKNPLAAALAQALVQESPTASPPSSQGAQISGPMLSALGTTPLASLGIWPESSRSKDSKA
jgi:hypothetical protein